MQSPAVITKSSLSLAQQQLIELMQRINFGRIENLRIHAGRPVLNPRPRIIRDIKFGGENGPRPETGNSDFSLKAPVLDMLAQLEALGDGVVLCLEIQRGLPFRMAVEDSPEVQA